MLVILHVTYLTNLFSGSVTIFSDKMASRNRNITPKKNKAVLILSSIHHDGKVSDDDMKKSEINFFTIKTKVKSIPRIYLFTLT